MTGPQDAGTTAGSHDQTLTACRYHWESAGLAPADIADMTDELRTHLTEAAARGRSTEDVTGPDLAAFAREWAHARTPAARRRLRVTMNVVTVLALLSLVRHLILRDTSVPITPEYAVFVAALLVILLAWPRRRAAEPTFAQFAVASGLGLALAVLAGLLLPGRVLFHLPLWVTAAVAVASVAFVYWDNRGRTNR